MSTLFEFIRELIDIPSVTGDEEPIARFLERELDTRGFRVTLQEVAHGRLNVFAGDAGTAVVVLCTHLDTVPPFMPSAEDDEFIYGRGACDAKGILAAMVTAAERLRGGGIDGVGLLFVVGEETDSAGARKANELGVHSRYIVVGEPTHNVPASGHKGAFGFVLKASGTAAHSAYPERGDSAIDRLLAVLERVRHTSWGTDAMLGEASCNVGTIAGGAAGNVIAPNAEARVLVRTVGPAAEARATLDRLIDGDPKLHYDIVTENDAVWCETLPGVDAAPVAFGSDIPSLTAFGKPLLFGPGNIHDAHTDDEKIAKRDVEDAVDLYCRAVTHLMQHGT
ncbi:MAG: M20/M25/M40 family metallo-hydrolase [Gemmatimonadetes bacterium]|nr:M20/M25/M40 family metallo-hydrolase [Gemmatimonadota bacterium]